MRMLGAVLVICVLFGSGCASSRDRLGSGVGMGLSSGALYRQAEVEVLEYDAHLAPECEDRRVVNTEVLEEPQIRVTPRDSVHNSYAWPHSGEYSGVPPVHRGNARYSRFTERWVVRRCGERVIYKVTFTPVAHGSEIEVALLNEPEL